jgi:uncharacterized phage protein (TIGR01671 family)
MNREVKFRGKRTDNGEWVCGYYFETPLTDEATGSMPEDGWSFLTGRKRHCISRNNCVYEVIPSTVGQYTGLKDKMGREVYEGDVLRCGDCTSDNGYDKVIIFNTPAYVLKDNRGFFYWHYYADEYEIIGNIHDNPEFKGETVCKNG